MGRLLRHRDLSRSERFVEGFAMGRLSLDLGLGLGPEAPGGKPWTVDSGLGRPTNQAEWDALIVQSGLTGRGFSLTYNFQEASGDLLEADGGLTWTAGGTTRTYQSS